MRKEIFVCDLCSRATETHCDVRIEVSPPGLPLESELMELCPSCVNRLYLHLRRPLPEPIQSYADYSKPGPPRKYAFDRSTLTPTEYQRAWRAANPERAKANQQRYNAKRKAEKAAAEQEAEVV